MQVLRCWGDLSTERPIGMAVGPVPWSAIVRWCEFHGLDRDATRIILHVVRQLDNEQNEAERAKRQADALAGPQRPKGRSR